jgi:hypothetical protein
MKCKNCIYWVDDGRCELCEHSKSGETEKDGFVCCDMEEYSAWLVTGPEFGCIHFKEDQGFLAKVASETSLCCAEGEKDENFKSRVKEFLDKANDR